MSIRKAAVLIMLAAGFASMNCGGTRSEALSGKTDSTTTKSEGTMSFTLMSNAFKEGEMIPRKYTCDGSGVSPELRWQSVPPRTRSLALITDDPDAPMGIWVHWVVFNIPPTVAELPEGVPATDSLLSGALQGKNGSRTTGYSGPCPPNGTHRYYFKLYALDTTLALKSGCTKGDLVKAMEGHIVAQTQLMGRYSH